MSVSGEIIVGMAKRRERTFLRALMVLALLVGASLIVYMALTANGSVLVIGLVVVESLLWMFPVYVAVTTLRADRQRNGV